MTPTRLEFHDYPEWAARPFADQVEYGAEVDRTEPVAADAGLVDVHLGDGRFLRTRNVVLATGLVPSLPSGVVRGDRIRPSSELLSRIEE